jgi:hypothetical protein
MALLFECMPQPARKLDNQGSLAISLKSGARSDPCISSVCNCDHDYYFELLSEEERDAQSICSVFLLHTKAISGLSPCEPNLTHCS